MKKSSQKELIKHIECSDVLVHCAMLASKSSLAKVL